MSISLLNLTHSDPSIIASDQASLTPFSTIPWMSNVISDPSLVSRPLSWHINHDISSEPFFRRTLNTPSTIPHFCVFVSQRESLGVARAEEVTALLELGPDLAGHPGICHGGVLSTVLDEVMGTLAMLYCGNNKEVFTASLTVDFRKPVPAPGMVLVRAWVEKREGRKISTIADVIGVPYGVNDGKETHLTNGRGLFIVAKDKMEGETG